MYLSAALSQGCVCFQCLYLQAGPEGLQRLENRHGDGPFMHLDPQVPVVKSGVVLNGSIIL